MLPGLPSKTIPARSFPLLESLLLFTGRQYIDASTYNYVLHDING